MDEQIAFDSEMIGLLQKGDPLDLLTAMRLAIYEAKKGGPFASPNPLVGCVVLDREGKLLSTGYHEKFGDLHAEANAIKNLSQSDLQGAHVIVTLEPCAHEGKQPSCAKALAKLPIAKVTYGLVDPNPLVKGQGAEILRSAGIHVETVEESDDLSEKERSEILRELEDVAEVFLKNFRDKKIFVSLKVATSLDGAMALKNGDSQWITGPEARKHGHYLRACHDLTLIGLGTFLHDNPKLNIRDQEFRKDNKVAILDPDGLSIEKLRKSNLYANHQPESIYVLVSEGLHAHIFQQADQMGINVLSLKTQESSDGNSGRIFRWPDIMDELWKAGIRSVMIEGGAQVASGALAEKIVDRIHLFQAPVLLGQKSSMLWNQSMETQTMDQRQQLGPIKITRLGQDVYLSTRLK